MNAPTLFDQPKARNTDPSTSHIAAARASVKATTHRARVLDFLKSRGSAGATDFEVAEALNLQQTSCGVRRKELERAGLVERTEMRRPSPSGSPAIVWRAT